MSELSMTRDEREAFLAQPHIAVLAVAANGAPPLVSPVWYRYAGGVVQLATEQSARKIAVMQETGQATLCVQREEYPYAYVTVDGPVSFSPAGLDDLVDIAARYLGPDRGRSYVERSSSDDVIVTITPENWYTADFAKLEGSSGD